ncbi:hypothetical protein [Desulfovibrio gilichinskyi]|uniref:Uncharacterized protein n=1 Tax=Desulfovibrio gilichinskyi TaxID=1519643 RepID=A0A1X7D1D0_9BACT|nr:hypothetical protein [Desulfovibrio gilichinskyi]SMF06912.1 hypothetical protein SAMN06295933_1524 [Desulfovibrio gilichinskyi]
MTGEVVEGAIIMLVIVFAIFHMVRKSSRNIFEETTSHQKEPAKNADCKDSE